MTRSLNISLLILGLLVHTSFEKLHDGFKPCKVKESHFESCLNSAIENGIKLVKNGLPEYNLAPLDPYQIPTMTVGAGSGPVNLEQKYNDIVLTGLTDIIVNNSHIDFDKKVVRFSSMSPLIVHKSQYKIDGKILMLPVYGTGPCMLSLENIYSHHTIQFDEETKQGEVYYTPKSYQLELIPAHARIHFDNLFDGNKLLGDNINNLINEEWYAIFKDVEEGYERGLAEHFLQFAEKVFEKAPVKEIFIQ